ncbi:hypothetical protein MBLNU13_g09318t1 [Cladosporium sp. NU13]
MSGTMQTYTHTLSPPNACAAGRKRHDSMLLNPHSSWTPTQVTASRFKSENDNASALISDARDTPPRTASHSTQPPTLQKQDSFRFLVTTNPTQFKNKVVMRENRKHVMNDFLRKERRKTPGTRDIRAEGPAEVVKRRRTESIGRKARKSGALDAPSHLLESGVLTPQSSNDEASSSLLYGSDAGETVMTLASRTASHHSRRAELSMALIPRSVVDDMEEDEHPMCNSGGDERNLHPGSCSCNWPEQEGRDLSVPDLFSVLGFKVSPYHTWLQTANTAVDLEKLNTICISAAHDEAMQRIVFGSETLSPRGSKKAVVYERLAVKSEVIAMINASLDDPDQRVSDATIIAVMNIFNSEIIGCDASALKIHQKGLNEMISMRGGLHKLGVNAVLQEDAADDIYLRYAYSRAAPPPSNGALFPESPIYCGDGFGTVAKILGRGSDSLRLLELLQKMTFMFQTEGQSKAAALGYFHRQVLSFKSKLRTSEASRPGHIYEAIRLTARIYADALVGNMEFSQAISFSTQRDDLGTEHFGSPAAYVEIVHHLMRTDLDRMWGGLSGILFFIVMVAGASARKAQVKELTEAADLVKERQEDEARRWLAAVAVRCSIVLGFEHGGSLLGTFTNMLCIQDKLSGREKILRQFVIGPDRRSAPQHGFGDFAWEFLAEDK